MSKEGIGTFLAFLTAIVSGVSIFANKFFITGLDATVFTAVRAIIIGLVFLVLSFYFHSWKAKENKKIHWGYLLFIGIVGGGIAFLLFFNGLQLTTAGRAGFLHKTLPLYATVLAFLFLKEKIGMRQGLALLIMLAGLAVMVLSSIPAGELWANPQLGDGLVIAATVLWAIENVVAKKAMLKGESNFVVSFSRMFFGGVLLFGIVLFMGNFDSILRLSGTQWIYVLASSALLFTYVLTFYWSIKYINVSKATTILLLAPVITLILGSMVLHEPAPAWQIVGSALILIGAYFVYGVKSEFREI